MSDNNIVQPPIPDDPYIVEARRRAQQRKKARKNKRSTGGRPQVAREIKPSPPRKPSKPSKPYEAVGLRSTQGAQNVKKTSAKAAVDNAERRIQQLADQIALGNSVSADEYNKAKQELNIARNKYNALTTGQKTTTPFGPKSITGKQSPDELAKSRSLANTPTLREGVTNIDWGNAFEYSADGSISFRYNNTMPGATLTPIAFIGGKDGKYIASTDNPAFVAGSPIAFDAAVARVTKEYMDKEGGLTKLKKTLADHGFYLAQQKANASLSLGEAVDIDFQSALRLALSSISSKNAVAYQRNHNQSILSFEDGLNSINLNTGEGGTTKKVIREKFTPDQFDVAVDELFQRTIGRGATKQELNSVIKSLQSYEKSHPQTQITKMDASGNATVNTSGGVDQGTIESIIQKSALANPEAKGFTQGSKYVGWLNEIIQDPMRLGNM